MSRNKTDTEWNRYEHIQGLANSLLSMPEATPSFVGLPQGTVGIADAVDVLAKEMQELEIAQGGMAHHVVTGLRTILTSRGVRLLGEHSFGQAVSLHNAVVRRRLLEATVDGLDIPDENTHGPLRLTAVDYVASGRIGTTDVKGFSTSAVRILGFCHEEASRKPHSATTKIIIFPRNESISVSGLSPEDALGFSISTMEAIKIRLKGKKSLPVRL